MWAMQHRNNSFEGSFDNFATFDIDQEVMFCKIIECHLDRLVQYFENQHENRLAFVLNFRHGVFYVKIEGLAHQLNKLQDVGKGF